MLSMESNIQSAFMHVNWPQLRKPWISAVSACMNARDFARAIIVLQACIKPVAYAPVWSDQLGKFISMLYVYLNEEILVSKSKSSILFRSVIWNSVLYLFCNLLNIGKLPGHVKLQRITAVEREERKRMEKKEKKDKDEEEERNRWTNNFVKYTLGLKHQVRFVAI